MKILSLLLITFFSYSSIYGQAKKKFNVDSKQGGFIFAGTAIEDSNALGGFGQSKNIPKQIDNTHNFLRSDFYLLIDTTQRTTFRQKFIGYKFYIVNSTDSLVKLNASDSRLKVIAEAFIKNQWLPIEYLPSSMCGNSFHHVYIKPNQYWEFSIPKYSGKIKTKIRYRLELSKGHYLYSNEISGRVNKNQLIEKQCH